MSQNSDPQDEQQTRDPRSDMPGDIGWEHPEYEQALDDEASERDRATIELPAKRRGSPGHAATDMRGDSSQRWASWLPGAATAVLAACLGAAIALALASPTARPQTPLARQCAARSLHRHTLHSQARPATRRRLSATRRRALAPAASQRRAATAPELPIATPRADAQPEPARQPQAPAPPAEAEGQTRGGPFSP